MVTVRHKKKNQWTERWADVPEGHRPCFKWKLNKPLDEFHNSKMGAFGKVSVCKVCHIPISKQHADNRGLEKRMVDGAKSRLKSRGWECNIEHTDIIIPEICPVLKIPLVSRRFSDDVNKKGERKWNSPSLDRIDSTKGYIKGNIRVISLRANTLKSNGTLEEMRLIVADLEQIEKEREKQQCPLVISTEQLKEPALGSTTEK